MKRTLALWCRSSVHSRSVAALAAKRRLPWWSGDQSLPNSLFARQLARSPYSLGFLSCRPFRRLLIETTAAHLPEHTFTLHSLLQNAKCLLNIVVSYDDLH